MASQRFCLRWNNHQSNLLSVFDQLLHAETFTDVTLAVEGQYLKAHKMVLSACSPYFQVLFTNTPDDKHPILILKDITLADMKSLLDFMYRGEVSVDQERLTAFLRVAESLRIKGLTEVNDDKQPKGSTAASATTGNSASTVETSAAPTKTTTPASATGTVSNTPPQLHRIQPYVMQQQRKAQGMMLTNPLLGSALTQPKRKRGRPRKMSGSSNEGGDAADFDEFEARENLVQGSPELMEVQMDADGYSDNSDDRDADENDSDNDTNKSNHHRRTSPGDSAAHPKHGKDNSDSRKDHEQSPSDEITPANYANYLRYGLLIPKSTDARPQMVPPPQSPQQPKLQEQPINQQQPTQSPDHSVPQMSPPKIRINPMIQNSGQLAISALQQLHSDSVNHNNNNNNSMSIRQITSAPPTPTSNALTASVATTMANISSSLANSIVSNYLSSQHQQQQHQLLALQLQQSSQPPAAAPQPPPIKPDTPTQANHQNSNTTTANQNHSPQIVSSDLNPSSPGAADSTPTTPITPSGGGSIRPPQRRRVRRKVNSPSDDPAEHLTEMSVRGLDLFRYAKIFEGIYQCTECLKENIQKTFKNKYSFQRHAFLYHEGSQRKVFPCPVCNKEFSRPDKMKNHMKTTHDGYVPRDAAYPLSFLMGAGGDLPMSMAPFPKLSKAKLAKMEKLESLMMGPHIGAGHPALCVADLDANEAMLQQQRLLGHRMVDVDDIDDDMDLDEEDLPIAADSAPLMSTMQSKIDDVVQRIQMSQNEHASRTASPIDTIKVEDSDAGPVSD